LQTEINLPDIVGSGYGSFWRDKHRYRVLKGGRASKKSRTAGLWYIYNVMKYPLANALVVRNTFNTHKDSTFAVLKWAAERLKVHHLWQFKESPLEAVYKPTGQKILFRGFDDPLKLTSITVSVGFLCWVWLEEAYEIEDEEEFRTLDESIRGDVPEGYWKQLTLTYNPWVDTHWTKIRFFDNTDPEAFTLTTTYKCNEWLDDADRKLIEDLKVNNPDRYKVVGLGEYGVPGGVAFEEFSKDIHVCRPFAIPAHWRRWRSCDNGYTDPFAWYWFAVDEQGTVFIYREYTREYKDDKITYSEQAKKVVELSTYFDPDTEQQEPEPIGVTIVGHDAFNSHPLSESGKTIIDFYAEGGVTGCRRAVTDRKLRKATWHEYLKPFDDALNPGKQTAKVKIFSNCKKLIETLPQQLEDERNPEKVAETNYDHWYDGAGYGIIAHHMKQSKPPKPQLPPEQQKLKDHIESLDKSKKRKVRRYAV